MKGKDMEIGNIYKHYLDSGGYIIIKPLKKATTYVRVKILHNKADKPYMFRFFESQKDRLAIIQNHYLVEEVKDLTLECLE